MSEEQYWEPKIGDYLLSFKGRIGRPEFVIAFLAQSIALGLIATAAFYLLLFVGLLDQAIYAYYAVSLVSAYAIVALAVKRCHDINYSGAIALISFVPIVNFLFWLFLALKGGSKGINDFGPPSFQSYITPETKKNCPECGVNYSLFDFVTQPYMCAKCWRERKSKPMRQNSDPLG